MYARLVRFAFGPGKSDAAQSLADNLAPAIAEQTGCESVTIFGNDADGEYGIFVLWNTQADAEAAAAVIRPQLDQHLAGNVTGPPDTRLFEVLSS
jgi:quinol monooxygenase YgiN